MKFIHFSDTHLGFSDLNRVDPVSGINQREADFYAAWWQVIEAILQEKPDFVVHAGDLFQTPRPNNRAIRIALEGIQKLGEAGIPFVVVAGNHSTPRIRQTGSIFESLALFDHVYAAYQNRYEKFTLGTCAIHCIPHCSLSEELEAAYQAFEPDPQASYQILVTHGAWREATGELIGSVGEFNEQFLENPLEKMGVEFDYIALGHYHKHMAVRPFAVYSGSTERTSFNEIGYSSGYIRVDLARRQWEYVAIHSRPMVGIGPVMCEGLSATEIYERLTEEQAKVPEGCLLRLEFAGVSRETLLQMEARAIDEIFEKAFYVEKIYRPAEDSSHSALLASIGSLPVEFERYVEQLENFTLDKKKFVQLGKELLQTVEQEGQVGRD